MKKIVGLVLASLTLGNAVVAMQANRQLTQIQQQRQLAKEKVKKDQNKVLGLTLAVAGFAAVFGGDKGLGSVKKALGNIKEARDGQNNFAQGLVDVVTNDLTSELVDGIGSKDDKVPTESEIKAKTKVFEEATKALEAAKKETSGKTARSTTVIAQLKEIKLEHEQELLHMRLAHKQDELEKVNKERASLNADDEGFEDDDLDQDVETTQAIVQLDKKIEAITKEVTAIEKEIAKFAETNQRFVGERAAKKDKKDKNTTALKDAFKEFFKDTAADAVHKAIRGDGTVNHNQKFSNIFTGGFQRALDLLVSILDFFC